MNRPLSTKLVETLRRQIARLENGRQRANTALVSCGCAGLDRLLPQGGFRRGSLVEWLSNEAGCGAQSLALLVAREACRESGRLVVFDRALSFYPPAALRLGIEPAKLFVVQPENRADELWALTQVLRCPGVAAAVVQLDRLESHDFRRLQLAAESHAALGLLLRPWSVRREPSWAELRLGVESLPAPESAEVRRLRTRKETTSGIAPQLGRGVAKHAPENRQIISGQVLKVHLLRSRRGAGYGTVEIELHEETHPVHLVARLARPQADTRPGRAV